MDRRWRYRLAIILLIGFAWLNLGRLLYMSVQNKVVLQSAIDDYQRLQQAYLLYGTTTQSVGFMSDIPDDQSGFWRQFMMAQHVFAPKIVQKLAPLPEQSPLRPQLILLMTNDPQMIATAQSLYGLASLERIDDQLVVLR